MTGQWTLADLPDLTGRRALVTGATTPIGEALVRALADRGAEVVVAARDPRQLAASIATVHAAVPGAVLTPLVLDLADSASVRRAADEASRIGSLDLLVNNAGVVAAPFPRARDRLEHPRRWDAFGHYALTGLLLPLLLTAGREDDARVVSVASVAHRIARTAHPEGPRPGPGRYHEWQTYGQSQLGTLLFAFELDRRVRNAGLPLRAVAAHPGLTRVGRGAGQRESILDAALSVVARSPTQAALPLLMAATADLPGGAYVGPGGLGELSGAPRVIRPATLARDADAARRHWDLAEATTGVVYPWVGSTDRG